MPSPEVLIAKVHKGLELHQLSYVSCHDIECLIVVVIEELAYVYVSTRLV